jgi:outer membrane protein
VVEINTPFWREPMRRILVLAFCFSLLPCRGTADDEMLRRYVEEALRKNHQVEIYRVDAAAADEEREAAARELWPKAVLNSRGTRLNRAVSLDLPLPLPPGEELPEFVKAWQWQVGAQLTYPIYNGGLLRRNLELREAAAEAAGLQVHASADRLTLDVVSAYLDLKMAAALRSVQKEILTTAREHKRTVEVKLEQGVVSLRELKRAEAVVADAERELAAAENRVAVITSAFNFLLNRELEAEIDLSAEPAWADDYDLEEAKRNALKNRPEMEVMNSYLVIGDKKVEIARADYLPSFSLAVEGGFRDGDIQSIAGRDYWQVSLLAGFKLFDPARGHKVASAEASRRRDQVMADQLAKSIELDVTRSFIQLSDAEKQLDAAGRAKAAAEEAYRVAELQFEEGVIDQTTYLDADLALTSAKVHLEQARFAVLKAETELRYAAAYPLP